MADIIEMPKLSDTMTVGTLVKWLKKEGDKVATGDMLAEVETDKATMELECFFDGTLLKIFAPDGAQVEIGEPLCAVGAEGETVEAPAKKEKPAAKEDDASEEKSDDDSAEESSDEAPAPEPTPEPETSSGSSGSSAAPSVGGQRLRISPLARKLAAEKGIDLSRVKGTGTGGRIRRADILEAEKNGGPGGAYRSKGPIQEEKLTPVTNMRGTIARRLVESKTQIPHFYLDIEVDAAPLLALRSQLNSGLSEDGVKLSVNDLILKASAEALRKVPTVNCSWEGKQVRHHSRAHVSFAVAMPEGLITPVVFDAHEKSVFDISTEVRSLAKAAKTKKLQPKQFTGGTFCVSNLGMMGINTFKAIINPPNAAILAVGTTVEKPVVVNGQIVIGQRMNLTLSCDHRVVDGAVGAEFLGALKSLLENPALLLV
ncbi:pyruvate dehydrogenase complex dihydrolipoamide acetyltransferase [Actomonas aquatica]|uniref:Acetyltransferase component of pyruvate dehydrogenase complex n=1 Tax=Actomonas aquatica TaxID=2866162 RepID=A0ABZ1C7N2_9BACT|nr:pyruvate dehydrogenase complex dihydrolipoamide acetyltransferase [Opitutus sp. WL0086]WRQ87718.1 pyruvate dehydrogenase complex dihydrolipoamide acetyltransferase [Opitutus sp. WL0086]